MIPMMEGVFLEVGQWRSWASVGMLALLLAWESAFPFFHFFREGGRLRHGVRNLALGVVNGAVIGFGFAGAWVATAVLVERSGFGLLHLVALPGWLRLIAAILLLDLWTYAWHRMNHRIPFLWRWHRVHHSDPWMDATTANRFHLGEILFSSLLRIPVIALTGVRPGELAIFELALFAVVQFHHANISLGTRGDAYLSRLIVTPFMHKVHHSRWQPETDSNYASLLSVWDRIFGTFRRRERPEEIHLGLEGYDDTRSQSLGGLLKMPFRSDSAEQSKNSR